MTVRRLLREIDSQELTEWQAYYGLEPWGEERADLRAGVIAATNANLWRSKGAKPLSPLDFVIRFDADPAAAAPQSIEAHKMMAMRITAMLGGEIRG